MIQALPAQIESHLLEKTRRLFEPVDDADVEVIHRMRVASRRLRVGLRCFASLFPENELTQIQRQLRRTTRALSAIRTLDVNAQLLRRAPASPARTTLIRSLLAERVALAGKLRDWMGTLRTSHIDLRVQALVMKARERDPKRLLKDANEQVEDLREALRKRYRKFRDKRGRQAFHKMRIAAKRYRYALESSEAIFPVKVGARIRAVERLQDLMGACHDLEVLLEHLRQADKTLARDVGGMIEFFQQHYDRQFGEFKAYLREDRLWLKKVKLQLPHD